MDAEEEEEKKEGSYEDEIESVSSFSNTARKRSAEQTIEGEDGNEEAEKITSALPSKRIKTMNNVAVNKNSSIHIKKTSYTFTKAELENMNEKELLVIIACKYNK